MMAMRRRSARRESAALRRGDPPAFRPRGTRLSFQRLVVDVESITQDIEAEGPRVEFSNATCKRSYHKHMACTSYSRGHMPNTRNPNFDFGGTAWNSCTPLSYAILAVFSLAQKRYRNLRRADPCQVNALIGPRPCSCRAVATIVMRKPLASWHASQSL